jgi:dihydropteroate synthase
LDDIRERIQVNGRKVSEAALVEFVETVAPYITEKGAKGESPTFFEVLTAFALWEFERQTVDIAVLEVGIGGRYDATSVVDPVASAVTSVTLEHTGILGETIEEIAHDKAHVAPDDRPIVTGTDGEALAAVREQAGDVLTVGSDDDADVTVNYGGRDGLEGVVALDGPGWHIETRLPLLGAHQAHNAGIAVALARQVADPSDTAIERGLRNAHWPGRFEVMDQSPLTVIDGAHNPGGLERTMETLDSFEYDELYVVLGAMVDKDHRGMAQALGDTARVLTCEPNIGRAERPAVLAEAFESTETTVAIRSDVVGAVETAMNAATGSDAVLVTGSLYTVREARNWWNQPIIPKRVESPTEATEVIGSAHVTESDTRRTKGDTVQHVFRTSVQPRQAQVLRAELRALGGSCAVSELVEQDQERIEVVLMGTKSQFEDLTETLTDQPYGLTQFADKLRTRFDSERSATSEYPWSDGTAIMGILNVTPDSFHDGGEYNAVEDAVCRAEQMVDDGADIIDIGGESTRPGADPVPAEQERDRVIPVVEALADRDVTLSVDTRKAEVARAALNAGADILNDVSGLEDPEMRLVAAEYDVPVVVMHSIQTPVDPDSDIHYDDVVEDCIESLTERVLLAEKAGLDREQILVDPGIGFGKSPRESFELLDRIGEFRALGCPILIGHSHKSLFGLVGEDPGDCLEATIAGTTIAAQRGVDVIRVHDVAGNVAAVNVSDAVSDPEQFTDGC